MFGAEDMVPQESRIHAAPPGFQRVLLSPLDAGSVQAQDKYLFTSTSAKPDTKLEPKAGAHAMRFSGMTTANGGKGDFTILKKPAEKIAALGMWAHLEADANVARLGFQVIDAEGEMLMSLVDADWTGWQWVESGIDETKFVQAFPQNNKNGKADFPLRSLNVVWFARSSGETGFGADALVALCEVPGGAGGSGGSRFEVVGAPWGEEGEPFRGQILIQNSGEKPLDCKIDWRLQTNPNYLTPRLPDPAHGSDHARGCPSWIELGGERVENSSLTDEDEGSHLTPKMPKEGLPEVFQTVDLGSVRMITKIGWRAGDANWVRKMDVEVSPDGTRFTSVEGLKNIDLQNKWGSQSQSPTTPIPARYLRLRHHDGGASLPPYFRALADLSVFDGVADEKIGIPEVGETVATESLAVTVPARDFRLVALRPTAPLGPDAYHFGAAVANGAGLELAAKDYFVMPSKKVAIRPESRFGINVANAANVPMLTRAGYGWVRFENMKWAYYNPGPGDFRFDGTVAPWHVRFDEIFEEYRAAGLSILPYIFQTPEWASTAPAGTQKNVGGYPPKDPGDYGKAIFQAVARYGAGKVPENERLTADKLGGLGRIGTWELWNEPNLNAPGYGFFVGPLADFYKLFRIGAEAAKAADPKALVTNAGWAGLSMEWVDTMRTFRYPDGKMPLDFMDVINVHFYSGKDDPETALTDPNAYRDGVRRTDVQPLEADLIDLADWRDEVRPGIPIWVTETGNDVGGPIGLTERHQAAKLPRGNLLSFANGVEKVFVYRETGSVPAQHAGSGLIRDDGSARAAFFTLATQIRQLDGVTETRVPRLPTGDPGVWAYRWKRPGGDVLTAWAPGDSGVLGIDLGRCLVTSSFGAERELEVTRDFPLGMFPVYFSRIGNPAGLDALSAEAGRTEAARRKALGEARASQAWLLDFGSKEFLGTNKIGGIRRFTPVLIEDEFEASRGWGFVSAQGKNTVAKWLASPIEKDWVELSRPASFAMSPPPGTYELRFKGKNFSEGAVLKISGSREGGIEVPLVPGNTGAPTDPVEVSIGEGESLELAIPVGAVEWLTLVQKPGAGTAPTTTRP